MKRLSIILALLCCVGFTSCDKDSSSDSGSKDYSLSQSKSSKKGVCFNSFAVDSDYSDIASAVSWCYNWSSSALASDVASKLKSNGIAWYPMCWNGNYNSSAISASGAEYLLGFNEPNLTDQANMTPAEAAELWPSVVALAKANGMKLVSPAMNYGTLTDYHDPIVWLDEFFTYVSIDDVDAIAVHCYMPGAAQVKSFIARFEKYGKPIWLTEFCNGNSNNISETTQISYLSQTLNMLEQNNLVEKYAWFMLRGGSFNSKWHNSILEAANPFGLTNLGKVFVNFSTFDDSIVYTTGQVIPAEQYCYATGSFYLEPTSDTKGILDLVNFSSGSETHYHINVPTAGTYKFKIRYQTYMESDLQFGVSGSTVTYELQNTNNEWVTETFEITLPAGKSDLILAGKSGAGIRINWMEID